MEMTMSEKFYDIGLIFELSRKYFLQNVIKHSDTHPKNGQKHSRKCARQTIYMLSKI